MCSFLDFRYVTPLFTIGIYYNGKSGFESLLCFSEVKKSCVEAMEYFIFYFIFYFFLEDKKVENQVIFRKYNVC